MIRIDGLFSNEVMAKSDRCIHTPGNFAKQYLLYVQEVGRLQSLQPHRCIRENVDSYLFVIVLEGKGSLTIKDKNYSMKSGSCALINCMEHYEHISDEKDAWKLAWVHFNGHAAKGYYDLFKKNNKDENVFCVSNIAEWNELLGTVLDVQRERNLHAELKCGELLLSLVNRILECVVSAEVVEKEAEKQMLNELREQLNEHYAELDVLKKMEDVFSGKISDLRKGFIKKYGISIEEYVANRRFNAAKELLRFSIKPIDVVAEESGMVDLITMQQMFRENEGMSAEEYRMKWAQWIR